MSIVEHVPHSQADVVEEVQGIIEGDILTDPTVYGDVPTNPIFLAVGPDGGTIEVTYTPEINKRKKAGSLIRSGVSVLKKSWGAKLTFKASDTNKPLQLWCLNKSLIGGVVTPAASQTFLKSFNVGGTETFQIFSGCVPENTNISINSSGEIIFSVDLICKTFDENQTAFGGITLGTGNFAVPDTAAPWITTDGGAGALTINTVKYGIVSMSIDVTRQWAMQNPSESLEIMMLAETDYVASGTVTVEKSDIALIADALSTTARAMSLVVKAATLTLTWTNMIIEGHTSLAHDGTDASGLTDSESFSADDLVAA